MKQISVKIKIKKAEIKIYKFLDRWDLVVPGLSTGSKWVHFFAGNQQNYDIYWNIYKEAHNVSRWTFSCGMGFMESHKNEMIYITSYRRLNIPENR